EGCGELVGRGPGALDLFLGAADALLLGGDEGGQSDAGFDGAVPVRRARQPGDQSGSLQAGQDRCRAVGGGVGQGSQFGGGQAAGVDEREVQRLFGGSQVERLQHVGSSG